MRSFAKGGHKAAALALNSLLPFLFVGFSMHHLPQDHKPSGLRPNDLFNHCFL